MFFIFGLIAAISDPAVGQIPVMMLGMLLVGAFLFWWVRGAQGRDEREIEKILTMAFEED
jgi:hypothetical protein